MLAIMFGYFVRLSTKALSTPDWSQSKWTIFDSCVPILFFCNFWFMYFFGKRTTSEIWDANIIPRDPDGVFCTHVLWPRLATAIWCAVLRMNHHQRIGSHITTGEEHLLRHVAAAVIALIKGSTRAAAKRFPSSGSGWKYLHVWENGQKAI